MKHDIIIHIIQFMNRDISMRLWTFCLIIALMNGIASVIFDCFFRR
jgi:hypothetical protein